MIYTDNGDGKWTQKMETMIKNVEITFTSGVEFEETLADDRKSKVIPIQSIIPEIPTFRSGPFRSSMFWVDGNLSGKAKQARACLVTDGPILWERGWVIGDGTNAVKILLLDNSSRG